MWYGKIKQKSFKALNIQERTIIEIRYCRDFRDLREIALELGRAYTTITREIGTKPRHGVGKYQAHIEPKKALKRIAQRGNIRKLEYHKPLLMYVIAKLKKDWTPEQIAIRLPIDHKTDEAIYQYIYSKVDRSTGQVKLGELDLRQYLARKHTRRRKKGFRQAKKLARAVALPSIEDRPQEVQERTVVGHWEGNTMVSRVSKSRIKSMNELVCGITLFEKTADGTAMSCNKALLEHLQAIPSPYVQILTQEPRHREL